MPSPQTAPADTLPLANAVRVDLGRSAMWHSIMTLPDGAEISMNVPRAATPTPTPTPSLHLPGEPARQEDRGLHRTARHCPVRALPPRPGHPRRLHRRRPTAGLCIAMVPTGAGPDPLSVQAAPTTAAVRSGSGLVLAARHADDGARPSSATPRHRATSGPTPKLTRPSDCRTAWMTLTVNSPPRVPPTVPTRERHHAAAGHLRQRQHRDHDGRGDHDLGYHGFCSWTW